MPNTQPVMVPHMCSDPVCACLPSQGDEPAPEDEEEYEADEAEDDSEGSDEGESDGGNEVSHVLTWQHRLCCACSSSVSATCYTAAILTVLC